MELATVMIERRHSDQRGHLLAIEASQLGQIHEQAGDRDWTYARHCFQERGLRGEIRLVLDELADCLLQLMDLFRQLFDQVADVLTNDFSGGRFQTVLLGRAKLDELPAADHQLTQLGLFFRPGRGRSREPDAD